MISDTALNFECATCGAPVAIRNIDCCRTCSANQALERKLNKLLNWCRSHDWGYDAKLTTCKEDGKIVGWQVSDLVDVTTVDGVPHTNIVCFDNVKELRDWAGY